mgnify:CR=1 FL=1
MDRMRPCGLLRSKVETGVQIPACPVLSKDGTKMVERKTVDKILKVYGEAWMKQDPEKILTIFAKNATYHERVLKKPYVGHGEIKQYWQTKVVQEQAEIKFRVLKVYIDGDVVIAEWDATFIDKVEKCRKHIKEVAILEIKGERIKSLREYWASEKVE